MKSITVRLPETLVAEIEFESLKRRISKSDVVRERLQKSKRSKPTSSAADAIAGLIGSVDGLPASLSSRKKWHLRASGYGKNRSG